MHRGTSYLSFRNGDVPNASAASSFKIGYLILLGAVVFLLVPSPTGVGHADNGLIRQAGTSTADAKSSKHADPRERTRKLPVRLQSLLAQSQIVGNRLPEVQEGSKSVEEIIHSGANLAGIGHGGAGMSGVHAGGIGSSGHIGAGAVSRNHKSAPMTLSEVMAFLKSFLKRLNSSNIKHKRATYRGIWAAYHGLAVKWLYPWDQEYLQRMPYPKEDGSIYLSVASFRDEFCPATLMAAFEKAKNPDKLFVGLVQQNCEEPKCRSGILEGGKMVDVETDPDCYALFCSSKIGRKYCGNVRLLRMKESLALGPYMARYFAAKMWMGEQWYMQIDSHMTFVQDWDSCEFVMTNHGSCDLESSF